MDENFQDYKKPSMLLATCKCDWKCLLEQDLDLSICQNSELAKQQNIELPINLIIDRYLNNPITQAVIIAGLEPMKQFNEVLEFIKNFRTVCNDDIVIYTGYYPKEIENKLKELMLNKNIIVKFGRYIPNRNKVYDEVLGIELISNNQFAVKIS
jgi:hypothetical protein